MRYLIQALLLLAAAQPPALLAQTDADRALLKRIYQARMQLERDRQIAENEARANAPLVRQNSGGSAVAANAPGVTQLRRDTAAQLARFEQNFRCLDVDVDNHGGNTVIVCGGNSGDINAENTTAGRDLLNLGESPR